MFFQKKGKFKFDEFLIVWPTYKVLRFNMKSFVNLECSNNIFVQLPLFPIADIL